MIERILAVAELYHPSPEPFAVVSIYPGIRKDDGCESIVVSLHMTKEEAEHWIASAGEA